MTNTTRKVPTGDTVAQKPLKKVVNKPAPINTNIEEEILHPGAKTAEQIIDPVSIITGAANSMRRPDEDDDDINRQYGNNIENEDTQPGVKKNTVIKDENEIFPAVKNKRTPILSDLIEDDPVIDLPKIRKVAIKKIQRFNFRLNLEKHKMNLVPGTAHTFMCDKRGRDFLTGFDSGLYDAEKKRLERALHVDLGPQSTYWADLTFRMEDKEHGVILNFDDVVMGPYNESVYFGMLGSSIIANGIQEYKNGTKPMAEWYIENKEAEAEMSAARITSEQKAFQMFSDCSSFKLRGIGKHVGLPVWGATDKVVSTTVWDWLKGDKDNVNANKFIELASLHADGFDVSVLVLDAIKLNVLRKNRAMEYFFADVTLGPTAEMVIAKLVLPQFSSIRQAIQTQLASKQR